MQVFNRYRLRDFWADHSRIENELRAWFQLISSHDWASSEELTGTFPNLSTHLNLAAFDLRGSSYFVITTLDLETGRIWIRDILPHSEFRTEAWKTLAIEETVTERTYDDLVNSLPLRPVRDDDQLQQASARVDTLLAQVTRSRDEQDYLDVLSLLIADYERHAAPIPPVSGAEVLRVLITEHRLSQAELIALLGSKQKVQALLQGIRPLDLRQVTRSSRYFKLPPETFMDPDDLEIELPRPSRRRA